MCGLYGVAGSGIISYDIDVLEDLAAVSTLRGQDSTGIFQGYYNKSNTNCTYFIEKAAVEVNSFLRYHKYHKDKNSLLFNAADNLFAGHVRWATKGWITRENAHPFEVGGIVGMHNGTLREKEFEHSDLTDSEMMFRKIDNRGIEEVLSQLYPDSAYAMLVIDKKTGVMTFARNEHRSLHCCFNTKRNVLYWHSEAGALEWVLSRNRSCEHDGVKSFTEDKVYTIAPWEIDCHDPGFREVKELPPRKLINIPKPPKKKGGRGTEIVAVPMGFTQEEWDEWNSLADTWDYTGADGNSRQAYYDSLPWSDYSYTSPENSSVTLEATVRDAKKEAEKAAEASRTLQALTWPKPKKKAKPELGPEVEPLSNVLEFNRTPAAPDKKYQFGRNKNIIHSHCFSCSRELSLVDQYFATKVEVDSVLYYDCTDCIATQKEMKEIVSIPTIN